MDTLSPTLYQVNIESLAGFRVACYSKVSLEPEKDGRDTLVKWLARQKIDTPVRHFGFDIDVSLDQKAAGLRGYEVWAAVPVNVQPSEGVEINLFPGGLYATFLLRNPFADPYGKIPPAWKALHEWVISSDSYRGANHQWLEEFILLPGGNNLKLYYPVDPVRTNGGR